MQTIMSEMRISSGLGVFILSYPHAYMNEKLKSRLLLLEGCMWGGEEIIGLAITPVVLPPCTQCLARVVHPLFPSCPNLVSDNSSETLEQYNISTTPVVGDSVPNI